jgi:ribosomal-protein-alanine N-acetyltransferase
MRNRDLPAVMEIEVLSFNAPWVEEFFIAEMRGVVSNAVVGYEEGMLAAYAVYRVVADESHLMNLAVHPKRRGVGHSREILEYAMRDARDKGAQRMFLEVRPSNRVARNLYMSYGFYIAGIRRAYYEDNGEDALMMEARLA